MDETVNDAATLIAKAGEAVTVLRDHAREHGMSHFKRDRLILDIWNALDALAAAKAEGVRLRERVRHVARGTSYTVLHRGAALQAAAAVGDYESLVIYQGDDGKVWARPECEFNDGRFEALAPIQSPQVAAGATGDAGKGNGGGE